MNTNIHQNNISGTTTASWPCMQPYMLLRLPLRHLLQSCLILCLGLLWFTESTANSGESLCLQEGGFHHCVDAKQEWVITGHSFPTYSNLDCPTAKSNWRRAIAKEGLSHTQQLSIYKKYFRSCAEESLPVGRHGSKQSCSGSVSESEHGWEHYGLDRGVPSPQAKCYEYERRAFYWNAAEGEEGSNCGDTSFYTLGIVNRKITFHCQDGYKLHATRPICYRALELEEEEPLSCQPYSPNPVSMQSGEKRLFEEDYAGTVYGGLRFHRSYRANGHLVVNGEEVASTLGENWQHNYSARLYPSTTKKGMHIRRGEGGGLMSFTQSGQVPYSRGGRSNQQLKKRGTGWRYERGDGYYEEYDPSGRLLRRQWKDARGSETLAYSGDRLASVTDSSGRKLVLSYDTKGRLIKLRHPGGEVRYTHGERNLVQVENADGSRRQYHYELSAMPGKVTGYSDRGVGETKWVRRSRYSYKDFVGNGGVQVLSTEHEGAGDKFLFDYKNDSTGRRSSASYRINEDWQEVFYFSNDTDYPLRLTRQQGSSPRDYEYNDRGQLAGVEIIKKGSYLSMLNFEYDEATGLEVVREEGYEGDSAFVRVGTRWSDRWLLPVLVTRGERKKESKQVTERLRESYRYDGGGRLLEYTGVDVVSNKKRLLRYGYDGGGRLLWADGYRDDVRDISRYEYDARGQRTKYTNALGQVMRYTGHDVHGNVTGERDSNGLLTSYSYDKRGRLVGMRVGDWETRYDRDQDGRVMRMSLADGSVLAYKYNTGGKLLEVKDSEGNRINYKRDGFGNVLEARWYDSGGVERRRVDRGYGYDRDISKVWERDGVGRWVREKEKPYYLWSLEDGVVAEGKDAKEVANVQWQEREEENWFVDWVIKREDVHGSGTNINLDVFHKDVKLVTDPLRKQTSYGTNGFGDRVWEENVATGRTSYEVDSAGNRTRLRSADGVVTSYSYDALGRLLRKDDVGSETDVSYTWDSCHRGSLCRVVDGGGQWAYGYTVHGLESSRSYRPVGVSWQLETSQVWDRGRLLRKSLPSGRQLEYQYHKNGQIKQILSWQGRGQPREALLSEISWLPFGDVQGYRHSNGLSEVWKYDQSYRLLEQKSNRHQFKYEWTQYGGGMLDNQAYAYTLGNGVLRGAGEYEYYGENRGRLEYEYLQRGNRYTAHAYDYDGNGNRSGYYYSPLTEKEKPAEWSHGDWDWEYKRLSYNVRAQLVSVGSNKVGYQYDVVGRRSGLLWYTEAGQEYTKYRYEYGSDRRLRRIKEPIQRAGGKRGQSVPVPARTLAEYRYDYRGLRVKKTVGNTTHYFNYDDQGRLWSEHRANGKVLREYVWLGYRPVQMVSYNARGRVVGKYAIHVDHLGTPRALTDRNRKVVWLWESDAFGNGAANEDVDGDGNKVEFPLRFPGQYYDKESGLHYNWHRYYDPTIGRYITSDPIGLDGGMNTYAYVDSNPLMYTDPRGLDCIYSISSGTMVCTNSQGQTTHNSSGWIAGQGGACQNNPSRACTGQEKIGPLPPGDYTSTGIPPHRRGTNTTRRSLTPDPGNDMQGRDYFQTHYCSNTEKCSRGCPSQPDWETIKEWNRYLDRNPNEPIKVIK